MIKSIVGAVAGAVTLGILAPLLAVVFGWIEFESVFAFGIGSAVVGAVLGFFVPMLFIRSVLFFLDPDLFG